MTVKDLITQILTQIGFAQDAGSISDADSDRVRDLINLSILDFNKEDFLHFTKDMLTVAKTDETTIYLQNPPLKIDSLTFCKGGHVWKIRQIEIGTFPAYLDGSIGIGPRVYVYDRIFKDGVFTGRIRLDRRCDYDLTAVVTNDMAPYESAEDTLTVPADFASMIRADVQYRLLANSDASETLKKSKEYERNRISQGIKEGIFSGIDSFANATYVDSRDVILNGYGRL